MHRYLAYAAYGWLVFGGVMHFIADVVSQYIRDKRPPGLETTLYYGLNTAFALGQVAFGSLGLFLAWRSVKLLGESPVLILTVASAIGWCTITFLFMEYWEPKAVSGIFCVLVFAAIAMRPR